MKPLLFLDVDGVINLIQLVFQKEQDDFEIMYFSEFEHAIVPTGMKERVERLTEHFSPVWATAWFGRANYFNDAWGWERWPFLHWHDMKLPAIVLRSVKGTLENPNRPWAFVDDDAHWEADEYVHKFGPVPNDGLVVPVAPHKGLTDNHVEQLIEFATRLQPSE